MANLKITVPTKVPKPGRKAAIFLVVALIVVAIAGFYLYNAAANPPVNTYSYKGVDVAFRADLREAAKVPVYPSDDLIYRDLMNPLVKNVTIAFKDAGTKDNPYYILEEMEIIPKMTLAYSYILGQDIGNTTVQTSDTPGFDGASVENYANLPGKIQNPIVALIGYKFANETSVRMEGHVTYISGKTPADFDKATVRFLMIIMGIDPSSFQ